MLNAVDRIVAEINSVNLIPLMTGASAGLYEFVADDPGRAEQVRDEVQNYLSSHSQLRHATFVIDVCPAQQESRFNIDQEMVIARNRWRQMQSPTVAVPAHNENIMIQACLIDGVRPATATIWGPENKVLRVSESVAMRSDYGREQKKQEFYREKSGKLIEALFTRDLDDLSDDKKQANLHHKIAVIYLDGNSFGKLKKGGNADRSRQKNFDNTVKGYRQQMLEKLLDWIAIDDRWKTEEGRYRLETLLWGGDEIIWVVPAWLGWEMLYLFFSQSKQWQFAGERLHHAGGMVLCHHNAPIHRITALAQQLAGLAKVDRTRSLLAYEVLESFDHIGRNLTEYRKERSPQPINPADEPNPEALIIGGDDIGEIIERTASIKKKLPRRKLHAIVDNLLLTTLSSNEIEDRKKRRTELSGELIANLDDQTSKDDLAALTPKLGGEWARWLHLSALWDYLA